MRNAIGLIEKLRQIGLSQRMAGKLVRAGYTTPKLIRATTDEELLTIPSIKEADVAEIREKVG